MNRRRNLHLKWSKVVPSLNTVVNLRVPLEWGFLTSWGTSSFSWRKLLRVVAFVSLLHLCCFSRCWKLMCRNWSLKNKSWKCSELNVSSHAIIYKYCDIYMFLHTDSACLYKLALTSVLKCVFVFMICFNLAQWYWCDLNFPKNSFIVSLFRFSQWVQHSQQQ